MSREQDIAYVRSFPTREQDRLFLALCRRHGFDILSDELAAELRADHEESERRREQRNEFNRAIAEQAAGQKDAA